MISNMVNQQNLALQQMESARLAAEATQQRHLEALHQIGETVQPLVLPKLHCHECKSGVWRIFYNTIHPALMAKLARMELISGCGTWNESMMLRDVLQRTGLLTLSTFLLERPCIGGPA